MFKLDAKQLDEGRSAFTRGVPLATLLQNTFDAVDVLDKAKDNEDYMKAETAMAAPLSAIIGFFDGLAAAVRRIDFSQTMLPPQP